MIYRAGAMALLLSLAAWAWPTASVQAAEPCRQETPTTFILSGEINDALISCVSANFQQTTTEVVLNSNGGSVEAALDIAEHFEGKRLTMRVRVKCMSSCANFFLPLAGRLIVEPGAVIVLHGGIDPMLIAASRRSGDPDAVIEALSVLAERQMAFARRNNIHPGWLLYRRADETVVDALDGHWGSPAEGVSAYIIEEQMARSCLKGVDISPYQADLDEGLLQPGERSERLLRQMARSGTMKCNAMTWDDFAAAETPQT